MDKAPELWAYQATIIRAEKNDEGKQWVTYNRQFRRQALAKEDLNWSVTNPRLYNKAFTARHAPLRDAPSAYKMTTRQLTATNTARSLPGSQIQYPGQRMLPPTLS